MRRRAASTLTASGNCAPRTFSNNSAGPSAFASRHAISVTSYAQSTSRDDALQVALALEEREKFAERTEVGVFVSRCALASVDLSEQIVGEEFREHVDALHRIRSDGRRKSARITNVERAHPPDLVVRSYDAAVRLRAHLVAGLKMRRRHDRAVRHEFQALADPTHLR